MHAAEFFRRMGASPATSAAETETPPGSPGARPRPLPQDRCPELLSIHPFRQPAALACLLPRGHDGPHASESSTIVAGKRVGVQWEELPAAAALAAGGKEIP